MQSDTNVAKRAIYKKTVRRRHLHEEGYSAVKISASEGTNLLQIWY